MPARLRGWLGLAGLVPGSVILLGGILHSGFGYSALGDAIADPGATSLPWLFGAIGYPPLVVAGMIAALGLNLMPAMKLLRAIRAGGDRPPREANWLNAAVGSLSIVLIVTIAAYLVIENLPALAP